VQSRIISDFPVRLRTSVFPVSALTLCMERVDSKPSLQDVKYLYKVFSYSSLFGDDMYTEKVKQKIIISCCLLLSECSMTDLFVPMYDTNSQPDQDMFVSNLVSVQLEETKDKLGRCILILHLMCYSIQFKQLLGLIFIERRDSHFL